MSFADVSHGKGWFTCREPAHSLAHALEIHDGLRHTANRLEALKSNRKGQHSIRINDQWRICFRWSDGDAQDVEIVDYH
ncbi:type II toxin-antitoxin system RelE/ParE family toxin [Dokdonella sp.]|uniref:type II toxin-antitoxin system RelE/ParE family toxin n=1 Tax=Dokdonella sp. TaxID=2291710 RepID=UPI0025C4AF1A|nr:type II toxin-antitoxin system RelE/ParE family toxin [Dokdonella sp.]